MSRWGTLSGIKHTLIDKQPGKQGAEQAISWCCTYVYHNQCLVQRSALEGGQDTNTNF